jgi:hypothetical protein
MAEVTVVLPTETAEQAAELAAAIQEAGSLKYTNVEGNTVNVQVGSAEASG